MRTGAGSAFIREGTTDGAALLSSIRMYAAFHADEGAR
jgi:hypothetical protein